VARLAREWGAGGVAQHNKREMVQHNKREMAQHNKREMEQHNKREMAQHNKRDIVQHNKREMVCLTWKNPLLWPLQMKNWQSRLRL
jgi:hypothetical protein